MDIQTYRTRAMKEALDLVRRDLGPDASVLPTRPFDSRVERLSQPADPFSHGDTPEMADQADELRQLALRQAAMKRLPQAPKPPFVVVAGGRHSVGSTTIALNLSIAMARAGGRIVLVDADSRSSDATRTCGITEGDSIEDVLSGRRTLHEVLRRGPGGVQVLPGSVAKIAEENRRPIAQQRMLAELSRLGHYVDRIILDIGSGTDSFIARYWDAASLLLLVTSCEPDSITQTYATIKILSENGPPAAICALVNRATSESEASSVQTRISNACQRFLGFTIQSSPSILEDPAIAAAARHELHDQDSSSLNPSAHFERLAAYVFQITETQDHRAASAA